MYWKSAFSWASHLSQIFKTEGTLNNDDGDPGLPPRLERRDYGELSIPSTHVIISDPQYVSEPLRLGPTVAGRCRFEAEVVTVNGTLHHIRVLTIKFSEQASPEWHHVGNLPIDSAKAVVADADELKHNWAETGPDRIGVISTVRDQRVVKRLQRRFGIRTVRINGFRTDIVGPVSEDLEKEITDYLTTFPEYADFPFVHFYVETNSSFTRANYHEGLTGYIPIGNNPHPEMFVFATGLGDGTYSVYACKDQGYISAVKIEFVDIDTIESVWGQAPEIVDS